MQAQTRTVSKNGQVAIPKKFLEAMGVTPPAKVQVVQEREAIVIRRSPMTQMSDEAFQTFLNRIRHRNVRVTQGQVQQVIRQVRSHP